jgi:hypothetical protein
MYIHLQSQCNARKEAIVETAPITITETLPVALEADLELASDFAGADLEVGSDGEGFVLAGPRGGAIDRLDLVMRAICAHLGIDDKVTPQTLSVECGCSFDVQARSSSDLAHVVAG